MSLRWNRRRSSIGRLPGAPTFGKFWHDWLAGRRHQIHQTTVTFDDRASSPADLPDRLPVSATERANFHCDDANAVAANILVLTAAAHFCNSFGVETIIDEIGRLWSQ
jgi:hypothetical protein